MKTNEKKKVFPNENMKKVNPIQQIVSNLIKKGINASIVQRPPRISFPNT